MDKIPFESKKKEYPLKKISAILIPIFQIFKVHPYYYTFVYPYSFILFQGIFHPKCLFAPTRLFEMGE